MEPSLSCQIERFLSPNTALPFCANCNKDNESRLALISAWSWPRDYSKYTIIRIIVFPRRSLLKRNQVASFIVWPINQLYCCVGSISDCEGVAEFFFFSRCQRNVLLAGCFHFGLLLSPWNFFNNKNKGMLWRCLLAGVSIFWANALKRAFLVKVKYYLHRVIGNWAKL